MSGRTLKFSVLLPLTLGQDHCKGSKSMFRTIIVAGAALALGGCALTDKQDLDTDPIIPARSLQISDAVSPSLEALAGAAVVYYIVDPLAPNWQVQEARLAEDLYRIDLKRKRFSGGGDGEAMQVFNRRAEKLALERGYSGYQVLRYTEGIESGLPGPVAQRVSGGTIRLTRAP